MEAGHDANGTAPPQGEVTLEGIAVSPGIAIGPVYSYARAREQVEQREIVASDVPDELQRFELAVERSERDLRKIATLAEQKIGSDSAAIFEAQALMLRDRQVYDAVQASIRELHPADASVRHVLDRHRSVLQASESAYLRERAHDLLDLEDRLLRHLRRGTALSQVETDSVVAAPQLSAADVVLFSRRGILGLALEYGGTTSHVSIMARALGTPAVVGVRELTDHVAAGDDIIVDGLTGRVVVRPSEQTRARYLQQQDAYARMVEEHRALVPLPAETPDGHRVALKANLEFREELGLLEEFGAEGIGLFRTEILILMRQRLFVSEEQQTRLYRSIVTENPRGSVTFRVLDLGGDKMLPLGHREANPFLGWRGLRLLLDKPDVLVPQLRAILQAAAFGEARLLLPMVTTLDEVHRFRRLLHDTCDALRAEGLPHNRDLPVGIMVEVPAVALMADRFAPHVDFFSIGTNDLTQYTLAVDRGNDFVAGLFDELNPSVLRLIEMTIRAGHDAGIPVGLCGELAARPEATPILIGMGLDEFSLSPVYLPEVKAVVRKTPLADAQALAHECLLAESAEQVHCLAERFLLDRQCDFSTFLADAPEVRDAMRKDAEARLGLV
jgi:phosphotransferase system enzyme I (PtsI)